MLDYIAFKNRFTSAIEAANNNPIRDEVIKFACVQLRFFEYYLQLQTLNYWSELFNLPRNLLDSWLTGEKMNTADLSQSEFLKVFLQQFNILYNTINGQLSIYKNSKSYTVEELELEAELSDLPKKHIPKFLNPANKNISVVRTYNPIAEMFKKFADNYEGQTVIGQLADTVKTYNFNEPDKATYYKDRMHYFLRKWLIMAAGQALAIATNNVMLLFIEPLGGSGKSYLVEWLFSLPELKPYYIRIGENESFMDMKGISKGKFAIDWDELPLSRKRYQMFKSHIAAKEGQEYDKDSQTYKDYKRLVNFIGSSNKANRCNQP
ncbi:MAG TPA: hypothetical protein DCQ31_08440, partial [Bacteroidales bacterium]|nr:hypothetical protein [Bacteroidales bacterium]